MSKHSPAPWGLRKSDSGAWAAVGHAGIWIATTLRKQFPSEDEANARLIAAAPELLEALKAALSLIEIAIPFDGEVNRMVRNAIAKAEGGAA